MLSVVRVLERPAAASCEPPLCVDLDGTLVRTDTLLESVAVFLRAEPWRAWRLLPALLRGRAALKREIASHVSLDPATLPYNAALLDRLRCEHARGRRLVLISAADLSIAARIASYLGIFSEVVASDGERNLKGRAKCDALIERYGEQNFDYAGDAHADLIVWRAARRAVVVNASQSVTSAAPRDADRSLSERPPFWPALLRAVRPHQWLKNVLIFIPLLMSHRVFDGAAIGRDVAAFVAFSLCASGLYIINDFLDLQSDRVHRSKQSRPLAAGDIALSQALWMACALVAVSVAIGVAISPAFALVLVGYLVLTAGYSLSMKRIVLLDVFILALLYAARIFAGAVAAGVVASFWLLTFALFMFTSLALLKRYSELIALRTESLTLVNGRSYATADMQMISMFGIGSGYIAVLVVAMYIHGDLVRSLYAHPALLGAIAPVLLYWISRTWLIAHRGEMHDDPILFALKDRASIAVAALCLGIGLLATLRISFPF